ncbi:MAG: hypothetical protein OXG19_09280 [Chloroflexi bacterium]|nr:hypothetical protein [Chloroflexota bacterium]
MSDVTRRQALEAAARLKAVRDQKSDIAAEEKKCVNVLKEYFEETGETELYDGELDLRTTYRERNRPDVYRLDKLDARTVESLMKIPGLFKVNNTMLKHILKGPVSKELGALSEVREHGGSFHQIIFR